MLAFYPLDQLVTRAQAASKGTSKHPWKALVDVVATEGVSGLYRGLNSTLITLFAANFIYFYAFHFVRIVSTRKGTLKDVIEKMGLSRPVFNLLLGTFAGAINVMFVQPLWVANARLKLQGTTDDSEQYKGILDVIVRIYREEGVTKLWAGVSSSLLLCCNPAIQFAVYETIKRILVRRKGKKAHNLRGLEAFVLGAFSKWIATIATYPLQVAQTRLRSGKGSEHYHGTFHCLLRILQAEGRGGLYRGMETKLWHSTLISALMFLTYEKIQKGVGAAVGNVVNPRARQAPPAGGEKIKAGDRKSVV